MKSRWFVEATIFLFALLASGCGGGIEQVRVYTPGIALAADDGSFRIEGETPAPRPFRVNCIKGPHSPVGFGDSESSPSIRSSASVAEPGASA